jgi:hypothetical protein
MKLVAEHGLKAIAGSNNYSDKITLGVRALQRIYRAYTRRSLTLSPQSFCLAAVKLGYIAHPNNGLSVSEGRPDQAKMAGPLSTNPKWREVRTALMEQLRELAKDSAFTVR